MANNIGWCDQTINPIRVVGGGYHCTKVSAGCKNCYAETMANRFWRKENKIPFDDRDVEFELNLSVFDTLPKKKSKRVFVQSMGDLFHRCVPDEFIRRIWCAMSYMDHHTFIILTKRPDRAKEFFDRHLNYKHMEFDVKAIHIYTHIWLGVSCENQEMADLRIPQLLAIPAAKHIVSIEPMLGPIDITYYLGGSPELKGGWGGAPSHLARTSPDLEWVICGEETGPDKRPCRREWVRWLKNRCLEYNTPFYLKKIKGQSEVDGREWHQFPEVSDA